MNSSPVTEMALSSLNNWWIFTRRTRDPLNVGTSEYELFSPIFDRITIRTGGHKVRIKASGRKSYEAPVREILVDGKKLDGWEMDHGIFRKNSKIIFKY